MTLFKLKCLRCNAEWVPRTENPKMCPSCRSRLWNKHKRGTPEWAIEEARKAMGNIPSDFQITE